MVIDRNWVKRNLGYDPVSTPAPPSTFEFAPAAHPRSSPEDLQREIIDFDSEAPAGKEFLGFTTATGLSRFTEINWPSGLAPKTGPAPSSPPTSALPKADVLVVTWTVDEGHALSRVLTPGKDSRNDYRSYTHNFSKISQKMSKGCPAIKAGRLGAYWTTAIAGKKVVVFKSDSHLSQHTKKAPKAGETLPNYDVWQQIIEEVSPGLVITTGTAGGIGTNCEVGDVVVSPIIRFDCTKWLKKEPFRNSNYTEPSAIKTKYFSKVPALIKFNVDRLPPDNSRPPKIIRTQGLASSVVTTDFFGFDTSDNRYGLKGLGQVCEMGDAVLGMVASDLQTPPRWVAVRNVSDPQIKAEGTIKDQAKLAATIYKGFGRWSTVCSAIVCWALIAAE
jgi:nucleoside phosphorylase